MVKRTPLTGRDPNVPKNPVVVSYFRRSSKYKTNRAKISAADEIWVKDFGYHIKYGYTIPAEYNIHPLQKGYRAAHIIGQKIIIKYKVIGDEMYLVNIGNHKEVYGATRRFK